VPEDHEILTNRGFMNLDAYKARAATDKGLLVAGYDAASKRLVFERPIALREFAHATRDMVFLGVLYAALALPVKSAVGIAAGTFSERILRSRRAFAWMSRAGGAILIALGARLAAGRA